MISANYLTVSPAYGRDYKSKAEATAAFAEGQDFKMESLGQGGTYCSARDFEHGVWVSIRYEKMTKITNYRIP